MEAQWERSRLPLSDVAIRRRRRQGGSEVAALSERNWNPALRHVQIPFLPGDRLIMWYGHPAVTQLGLQVAAERALSGEPVIYLDAGHTFDSLVIGRFAKARRQQPRRALNMIHVARAFSWHQMERLTTNCLSGALDHYQARTAIISGLFEALAEEPASDREIVRMSDRFLESIAVLTRRGCVVLCPCPSVPLATATGHRLFVGLRCLADRSIRVRESQGGPLLTEEDKPALESCQEREQ